MTPEQKLLRQLADAVSDTRFADGLFAHTLAVADPPLRSRFIQLAATCFQLLAINYDYGNFSSEDFRLMKFAAKVRDLVESGEFSDDDDEEELLDTSWADPAGLTVYRREGV
jgi:hypothetical protein